MSKMEGAVASPPACSTARTFEVRDYDLASTLTSGQAFRWRFNSGGWTGIIGRRWVHLQEEPGRIHAELAEPASDWQPLIEYLQVDLPLDEVLRTFPRDLAMQSAVSACRGLRLLRQDPWECLASFILSSTKQIVQIQQIIGLLCERFGEPLAVPAGHEPVRSFPTPARLAQCCEADLRACKMGFRANYLLTTARRISGKQLDLERLRGVPLETARAELMDLPGVGRKIADCVLLFAYGFPSAFPVDVWVAKALRHLYFPRRRQSLDHLQRFAAEHFGPNAGYAQQYLFHYMRTHAVKSRTAAKATNNLTVLPAESFT